MIFSAIYYKYISQLRVNSIDFVGIFELKKNDVVFWQEIDWIADMNQKHSISWATDNFNGNTDFYASQTKVEVHYKYHGAALRFKFDPQHLEYSINIKDIPFKYKHFPVLDMEIIQ